MERLRLVENPVDRLARTIEALLVIASKPLSIDELATVTEESEERVETALGLIAGRLREGRSGIVLEHVAGGYALRASRDAAEACARLVERPVQRGLSQAALETLAVVAYLGPISRPEIARIRGVAADSAVAGLVERALIAEAGRDREGGAVRYETTPLFERVFGLSGPTTCPSSRSWAGTQRAAGPARGRRRPPRRVGEWPSSAWSPTTRPRERPRPLRGRPGRGRLRRQHDEALRPRPAVLEGWAQLRTRSGTRWTGAATSSSPWRPRGVCARAPACSRTGRSSPSESSSPPPCVRVALDHRSAGLDPVDDARSPRADPALPAPYRSFQMELVFHAHRPFEGGEKGSRARPPRTKIVI